MEDRKSSPAFTLYASSELDRATYNRFGARDDGELD
jgi:hypothetical protein